MNDSEDYKKPKKSYILSFLFSNFGLFILVSVYACIGAVVFVELEQPNELASLEERKYAAESISELIDFTSGCFWSLKNETNITLFKEQTWFRLRILEQYIIEKVKETGYDGKTGGWEPSWYFMNCVLLTSSIMTTIGYGHISPDTYYGQLFTIVFSIIGCPLLLVFLANIGDAMANSLVYSYSRLVCRWCRERRYTSELPQNMSHKKKKILLDDVVGQEEYMPTSKVDIPITICMVILSLFIMIGGVVFSSWEHWNLSTACYFTFVTISTIGYGDYVPGRALGNDPKSIAAIMKLLAANIYILIGMALLSMCINLMQEQMVRKCKWVANQVGMKKKSPDEVSEIGNEKMGMVKEPNAKNEHFRVISDKPPKHAKEGALLPGGL